MRQRIYSVLFIFSIFIFLLLNSPGEKIEKLTDAHPVVISDGFDFSNIELVKIEPMEVDIVSESEPELISLGEFRITAYCSCYKCCEQWALNRPEGIVKGASGKELIAGYSIAVDPKVLPYGTKVVINGKTYEAMDCGGAIKGTRIDIYCKNHSDTYDIGVKYAEVFILRRR